MNQVGRGQMWTARARRVIVILVLIAVVVLGARAVLDAWMGRRLNNEIARLEKEYGPLRKWNDWPWRIMADNRARLLEAAATSITLSDWRDDLLHHWPSKLTADQARRLADQNREAVQLAIRAARLPVSNWDIYYGTDLTNVPDLGNLGYLSTVLAAAARSDADSGRADEAVNDVVAGFAEAASLRGEPVPIMALFSMRVAAEQTDGLKDILGRSEPSAASLASLAAAIDSCLVGSPTRAAMLGELKHSLATWALVERQGIQVGERDESSIRGPASRWMRGAAWLFRPVIRFMARRDLTAKAQSVNAASTPPTRRAGILARAAGRDLGLINAGDRSDASVGLAAIAVALRRFRLDHDAYPNTLDELAPFYLKAVPLDPFTDRAPDYARRGAGFELRAHLPVPSGSGTPEDAKAVAARYRAMGEWNVPR